MPSVRLVAALSFIALSSMARPQVAVDPAIRPGDDFYHYANNPWLLAHSGGQTRVDTTSLLRADNALRIQDLINKAENDPTSPTERMVGDYYASLWDSAAIEARGFKPLSGDFARITAILDRRALSRYLGETIRLDDGTNQNTQSLFGIWIHQGFHDPDHYAVHVLQGGLGLQDQGDYLDPGAEHAANREHYIDHIGSAFRAAGFDQWERRAKIVFDLEMAIARSHASAADSADVHNTDNTWRFSDFAAKAPGIAWDAYFKAAGLRRAGAFVVWQPQAVIAGSTLVATYPLDAWKDYLTFHLLEHYASVLPGSSSGPDGNKQALAETEGALGDAVGRLYVERFFPLAAKTAATAMVDNIRLAFRARITGLTWMSPGTKTVALAKLESLRLGLGYPENWIDFSALKIVRGDAFGNFVRSEAFAYRRAIEKLERSVDPDEWADQLHPQMVGAILNLSPNSMQFAAGLLQAPYFDPSGDAASNYGSAGAGIAHEISHSFDEVGNIYDARGSLAGWWTSDDLARYRDASSTLLEQLNSCCPEPGLCTRGPQVLGESIADLAGLLVAHDAYQLSLHGRTDAIKDGLSGEQRFFIAFAQRWRRQQSDDALHQQIATDSHAPALCRSNIVRNSDAWRPAFHVRPGDKLSVDPQHKVKIW